MIKVNINEILSKLENVKANENGYIACCPIHEDKTPSLSISEQEGKILIHCHAGCDTEEIIQELGLTMGDLFTEKKEVPIQKLKLSKNATPEEEYIYYDLEGNIVHKTIRYGKQYNKPFTQARPNPKKPNTWIYDLKNIKTVIYKLPQVASSIKEKKPIFIVEGEKDCNNLEKLGFTATTCPMGAGKWKEYYSEYLKNAICYIIPDNDKAGKEHSNKVANYLLGKAQTIKILDLKSVHPNLKPKGDITDFFKDLGREQGLNLLNELIVISEEIKIIEDDTKKLELDIELNKLYQGTEYFIKDTCLWRYTENGEKQLASFVPIPTSTLRKDDGLTTEMYFKIKAKIHGNKTLPEITIPATTFNSMQWVSSWGYQANYAPGSNVKDYIRHAIMSVGVKHAIHEDIYTYTGWRKLNHDWVYLYNGGAIGKDNITVELEDSLLNYKFPAPVSDYSKATQTSYNFINVAPTSVTIPLLSLVYLTPLNEFLKQAGHEPAYIIFLLGITGAMKSTLTALALSHFGSFTGKNLPSSFKDTSNAIEKKGFYLKDSLTAIDDYHPSMQKSENSKMEKTAQQITRSYGDRTGRSRMNSDTSLKQSYVPRGNLIITGEDVPNIGQSGIARHLILELKKGDINKELLTELQSKCEELNITMRGYIEWLLPQAKELPNKLKEMFLTYRDKAQNNKQHARMPETVAWLQIGYKMFLEYATHVNVIKSMDIEALKVESFNLFIELAEEQSRRIENDKPTVKFINALRELLATSVCYVEEINDELKIDSVKGLGFLGYKDKSYYYLHGETAVKEVIKFYNQQGVTFPVTKLTLLKQLETERLISVDVSGGRIYREKYKMINGKRHRFIWLKKEALEEKEPIKELSLHRGII